MVKRKIFKFLMVCTLILISVGSVFSAVEDNFDRVDSSSLGTATNGNTWINDGTAAGTFGVKDNKFEFKVNSAPSNVNVARRLELSSTNPSRIDIIGLNTVISGANNNIYPYIFLTNGNSMTATNRAIYTIVQRGADNSFTWHDGSWNSISNSMSLNIKYNISFRNINYNTFTYDIYINDDLKQSNANFYSNLNTVDSISLFFAETSGDSIENYVDCITTNGDSCQAQVDSNDIFPEPLLYLSGDNGDELEVYGASGAQGILDGAISFDGVDDYLKHYQTPANFYGDETTICSWVNLNVLGTDKYIYDDWDINPYKLIGLQVLSNNKIEFYRGGSIVGNAVSSSSLEANKWYHICAVSSPSQPTSIYIDSILDNSGTTVENPNNGVGHSEGVWIGNMKYNGGVQRPFEGKIDEVSIYNKVLNQSEIQSLYQGGNPTQKANEIILNPIFYSSMDALDDVSSDSNDFTNNGVTFTQGLLGNSAEFVVPEDAIMMNDNDLLGTKDFTISTWFYSNDGGNSIILSNGNGGIDYNNRIFINPFWNTDEIRIYCKDTVDMSYTATGLGLVQNKWYNLILTRNGSQWNLYLDGQNVHSGTLCAGDVSTLTSMRLGDTIWSGYDFNGKIDETAIYSKVLTQNEINALYQNGNPTQKANEIILNPAWYSDFESEPNGVTGKNGVKISDGKLNQGFELDGTNYINLNSNLNIGLTTQPFTFSAWVYPNSDNTGYILGASDGGSGTNRVQFYPLGGGSWRFRITGNADNQDYNLDTPPNSLLNSKWSHVVYVYNGDKSSDVYIDGTKIVEGPIYSALTDFTTNDNWKLGALISGNFKGNIDEVGIWNKALSQEEISQLYNNGNGLQYPFASESNEEINQTNQSQSASDWWDTDWQYKRKITVNSNETKSNQVFAINLDNFDYENTNQGNSLRVLNSAEDKVLSHKIHNDTQMQIYIESDLNQGENDFYLYYGNDLVGDASDYSLNLSEVEIKLDNIQFTNQEFYNGVITGTKTLELSNGKLAIAYMKSGSGTFLKICDSNGSNCGNEISVASSNSLSFDMFDSGNEIIVAFTFHNDKKGFYSRHLYNGTYIDGFKLFNNGGTNYISTAQINSTDFVIAYQDTVDSLKGKTIICKLDGSECKNEISHVTGSSFLKIIKNSQNKLNLVYGSSSYGGIMKELNLDGSWTNNYISFNADSTNYIDMIEGSDNKLKISFMDLDLNFKLISCSLNGSGCSDKIILSEKPTVINSVTELNNRLYFFYMDNGVSEQQGYTLNCDLNGFNCYQEQQFIPTKTKYGDMISTDSNLIMTYFDSSNSKGVISISQSLISEPTLDYMIGEVQTQSSPLTQTQVNQIIDQVANNKFNNPIIRTNQKVYTKTIQGTTNEAIFNKYISANNKRYAIIYGSTNQTISSIGTSFNVLKTGFLSEEQLRTQLDSFLN